MKLLILTTIAWVYLSPVGFVAVKLACARDGGQQIFETAYVEGSYYK